MSDEKSGLDLQARGCDSGEGGSSVAGDPGVLHHLMQAHALLWLLGQDLHTTNKPIAPQALLLALNATAF